MYYAHTLPDCGPEEWEPLTDHLSAVEDRAGQFAAALMRSKGQDVRDALTEWGRTLGRWHDLGKYSAAFQKYIRGANDHDEAHIEGIPGRVDHSPAGAQHAEAQLPQVGRLLAYALAGHHAGLADNEGLDKRLGNEKIEQWKSQADETYLQSPELGIPPITIDRREQGNGKRLAFQLAFFARMIFSCLIDADRLETEAFCDRQRSSERKSASETKADIAALSQVLDAYLDNLAASAKTTPVNAHRRTVLEACRAAAPQSPGLFSLTVPTGGGKTLASLAFALQHAQQHAQRRVIMAIPFTSIIEQTAENSQTIFVVYAIARSNSYY